MTVGPAPTAWDAPIRDLYGALLVAWNRQDAGGMAALFAPDGLMIGFDGSTADGPASIADHLQPIFAHHRTPRYVAVPRHVRQAGPQTAILHAVAAMVPSGAAAVRPELHTIQTLVATADGTGWSIALFQNTPAAFHGRPELVEALTAELTAVLEAIGPGPDALTGP